MKNPKQAICEICNSHFVVKAGTVGRACSPICGQKLASVKLKCCSILSRQEICVENIKSHEKIFINSLTEKCCASCKFVLPYDKRNNKFCSRSCSATFNNQLKPKKPLNECAHCGEPAKRKFCSNHCSVEHNRKYTLEEAKIHKKNRVRETSAKYRASLKQQTPENVDRKAIQDFYANCPIGYEVDHIMPISKGGLHTIENLQYLTITENRRKGSKII
jgi:hypothetical protein